MKRLATTQTRSELDLNAPRQPHKYSWGINLTRGSVSDEVDEPVRAVTPGTFRYHSRPPVGTAQLSHGRLHIRTTQSLNASPRSSSSSKRHRPKPSMPRPWGVPRTRREASSWDPLRKDPELWNSSGEVSVFLYAKGQSSKGPSFKVYYEDLIRSRCDPLLALITEATDTSSTEDNSTHSRETSAFELYLPVPTELLRQDSFRWHLSTRNFFAWLMKKHLSLQDSLLGESLVELLNRMRLFRASDANVVSDLFEYADEVGYTRTANSPDNAAAMLFVSEYCERKDIWLDAFVNCVGMADRLPACAEYQSIGQVTRALITRAYLEMDLHLGHATKALANLLEKELYSLRLGKPEASCLERFRSFLHSYCVGLYGYWPPPRDGPFDNYLYQTLREQLEDLYHYLSDEANGTNTHLVSGNVPIGLYIDTFNTRNKFAPLPYTYPLIPRTDSDLGKPSAQRSLLNFKLGRSENKAQKAEAAMFALHAASNNSDKHLVSSPLVQAYRRFEEDALADQDPNITIADCRRIQWILVYGMLQEVLSITQAPPEVRDIQSPTYPLCCLTTGLPKWNSRSSNSSRETPVTKLASPPPTAVDQPPLDQPPPDSAPATQPTALHDQSAETEDLAEGSKLHLQVAREASNSSEESSALASGELEADSPSDADTESSQSTPRLPNTTFDAVNQLDPAVVAAILSGGASAAVDLVKSAAGLSIEKSAVSDESDSVDDDTDTQHVNSAPKLKNLIIPQKQTHRGRTNSNSAGDRSPLLSAEQLSASPSFAPVDHLAFTIERSPGQTNNPSELDLSTGSSHVHRSGSATLSGDLNIRMNARDAGASGQGLLRNIFGRKRGDSTPRRGSPDYVYFETSPAGAAPAPPVKRTTQVGRTLTLHRRPDTAPENDSSDEEQATTDVDFHEALHVHK